jgi:GntR family transcriptional regulator/MocR family aminotransferase
MAGRPSSRSRSPLGPELEVALVAPGPGSRRTRRELYEQLRAAIRSGRLAPGLRMPASRQLARHLGVSRNTVTAVYDLLLSEGHVVARAGGRLASRPWLSATNVPAPARATTCPSLSSRS